MALSTAPIRTQLLINKATHARFAYAHRNLASRPPEQLPAFLRSRSEFIRTAQENVFAMKYLLSAPGPSVSILTLCKDAWNRTAARETEPFTHRPRGLMGLKALQRRYPQATHDDLGFQVSYDPHTNTYDTSYVIPRGRFGVKEMRRAQASIAASTSIMTNVETLIEIIERDAGRILDGLCILYAPPHATVFMPACLVFDANTDAITVQLGDMSGRLAPAPCALQERDGRKPPADRI